MANISDPVPLTRWPKYLQIKQDLTNRLRTGQFDPNVPLPSEKMLAELGGVSVGTVRQALSEMAEEGLVRREHGRGTFVTAQADREPAQLLNVFAIIAPQLREGVYPSLVQGFEEASSGMQHQVQVGNSQNDIGRQANLVLALIDQMVGGVAIVPATSEPTPAIQIRQLHKHNIPVVCCHRTVEGTTTPSVVFQGEEIGFKAAEALLERGHRRIAHIYPHSYSMLERYKRGLQAAVAAHRDFASCELHLVEYGANLTPPDPMARVGIHAALTQLFSKPNPPTAIFCGNIAEAEHIYLQIGEFGLEIPRDLSLLCFGSTWRGNVLAERIASVCVDEHEIGAAAARLLHEMRASKRPIDNDEQIVFPSSLYEGETLGPAPKV